MLMPIEQHFTIAEVARALKKSTRTVERWIEAGKLRAAKLPGRFDKPSYAIPRSELEKWGVAFTENEVTTEQE